MYIEPSGLQEMLDNIACFPESNLSCFRKATPERQADFAQIEITRDALEDARRAGDWEEANRLACVLFTMARQCILDHFPRVDEYAHHTGIHLSE